MTLFTPAFSIIQVATPSYYRLVMTPPFSSSDTQTPSINAQTTPKANRKTSSPAASAPLEPPYERPSRPVFLAHQSSSSDVHDSSDSGRPGQDEAAADSVQGAKTPTRSGSPVNSGAK